MKKENKEELSKWFERQVGYVKLTLKEHGIPKGWNEDDEQAHKQIVALIKKGVTEDWLPTPENINALPEPVRKFIHDIETNTDPAHMVRENVLIKDTCKMLMLKLEEKGKVDQAFVNIWADKYLSKGDVYYLRKQVKLMLNEAGVQVVKK